MALKTALVAALLLMVAAIAPPAVSQRVGPVGNVVVSGTVPCSSVAINITQTTAVFANATVILLCGQEIVGVTVSNRNIGAFSLMTAANVTTILFPAPLAGCRLVVPTPLSVCNSSLAQSNGTLQATLQLQANVNLGGILGVVTNLAPSIFQLVP